MDYLLVERHGKDDATGELTHKGEVQIDSLVDRVQTIVGITPDKTTIVSSMTQRARKSAEISAKRLGLIAQDVLFSEALFPDGETLSTNKAKELDALRTKYANSQLLVMVGHINVADHYPTHVLRELGATQFPGEIEKGQGVLIDIRKKTYQIVP